MYPRSVGTRTVKKAFRKTCAGRLSCLLRLMRVGLSLRSVTGRATTMSVSEGLKPDLCKTPEGLYSST